MDPGNIIFIANTAPDCAGLREELTVVLQRAGATILNLPDAGEPLENELSKAQCAIFILGKKYGDSISSDPEVSCVKHQFLEAIKYFKSSDSFKLVVWTPPIITKKETDLRQVDFINEVRNNIIKNMIFSNTNSAINLVDDIRDLLEKDVKPDYGVKNTDIFLVFNELDESEAGEIIGILDGIIPLEKMNIIQDSKMNYSEFCSQQIGKSKLAVIYFKNSGDWALPFAQQIWKKIGGVSSHTPILLIGDEDPDTNQTKKLKAPKVISMIVDGKLIPVEIKSNYGRILDGL